MKNLIILFCVLIISFSDSNGQQKFGDKTPKKVMHLLFVGNSLTYTNNLPDLVVKRAELQEIKIDYKMIAFPNYAIADHWNDGQVQKLLKRKKFDFVILQQGPSSQIDGRNMLIEYGKKYREICEKYNSKLCYFMVWPSLKYYNTFDGVIKNYKDAASINNAILLPVGQVWKGYFDKTNNLQYYGPDGFHPSLKGSKIAAEVIVEHLLKN